MKCEICGFESDTLTGISQHIIKIHNIELKQYYDQYILIPGKNLCSYCNIETIFRNIKLGYRTKHVTCGKNQTITHKQTKCFICNKVFNNTNALVSHIGHHKTNIKEYYDTFIKQPEDGICKICNKETTLHSINQGYYKYCSRVCVNLCKDVNKKRVSTFNTRFGGNAPSCSKTVHDKQIQTCIDIYGVKNPMQSKCIKEKQRQTCLVKYGVESPMQINEIHQIQQKCSKSHKTVILPSGKVITKQGYEPQFIEHVFTNNLLTEDEIDYHPNGVKYIRPIDGKSHYYFPDFYIPKYNLIIEIKSSWTEKIDKNLLLKEQACKHQGYNYIRIVNSNFDIFNKYLQEMAI